MNDRLPSLRVNALSQRKALLFLQQLIARQIAAAAPLLPPIGTIARDCGVSYVSMYKAMKRLSHSGAIATTRGRNARILTAVDNAVLGQQPVAAPTVSRTRSDDILARIAADIRCGAFISTHRIPRYKELKVRYGSSHGTLLRALHRLAEQGLIARDSAGYSLAIRAPAPGRSTIYLIAASASDRTSAPRIELLRCFEYACNRKGISFRTALLRYHSPEEATDEPLRRALARPAARSSMLGCVLLPFMMPGHLVESVWGVLRGSGKPVMVLHESDASHGTPSVGVSAHVRHFSVSVSPMCGLLAGRYIADLGHREIAWISPFKNARWSQERCAGVLQGLSERGVADLAARAETDSPASTQAAFDHAERIAAPSAQRFREFARASRLPANRARDFLYEQLLHTFETVGISLAIEALLPELDRLAADRRVTAWIAANDLTAFACLDLLERRRIAVPRAVSLLGFDDGFAATERKLTSYNFAVPALVDSILSHILHPSLHSGPASTTPIEIPGFVNERLTTAALGGARRRQPAPALYCPGVQP